MGELVTALLAVAAALLIVVVLVIALVRPPLRRFVRARASFRSDATQRVAPLRGLVNLRRPRSE